MKENFSNKITVLSFVMSIFVIFIHANNLKYYGLLDHSNMLINYEITLFADAIGGIAVPFFFFLSGFWFFRMNIQTKNVWRNIRNKNIKKINTLIIPYVFWNTLGMIFYMFLARIPLIATFMNNSKIIPINLSSIINGIFNHKFYFPFWYMKELIIISFLVTPMLVLVLRRKRLSHVVLILIVICSFFQIDFHFVQSTSILFFFQGALIATFYRKWFEQNECKNMSIIYLVLLLICIIIRFFNKSAMSELCLYASPILLVKSGEWVPHKNVNWFVKQSFFIYASHIIPVTAIGHILRMVSSDNSWATVAYIIAVLMTLIILWIVAHCLVKISPYFYSLISGGR